MCESEKAKSFRERECDFERKKRLFDAFHLAMGNLGSLFYLFYSFSNVTYVIQLLFHCFFVLYFTSSYVIRLLLLSLFLLIFFILFEQHLLMKGPCVS